ncbi:MAG: hypothetical protein CFH41_02162 [Alphaproteobacteria bacterium MarineAlpha11_Bin1]|nr:MAG: hypothetical protein CFH41_02162 [Alphaproteobacteria bacterium MarineAlpha11_Bin1]|tara:strand:- start:10135 stop:10317 length:183 start_codon:yes stop_codon:yes gene_type:complete
MLGAAGVIGLENMVAAVTHLITNLTERLSTVVVRKDITTTHFRTITVEGYFNTFTFVLSR